MKMGQFVRSIKMDDFIAGVIACAVVVGMVLALTVVFVINEERLDVEQTCIVLDDVEIEFEKALCTYRYVVTLYDVSINGVYFNKARMEMTCDGMEFALENGWGCHE